MQVRWMNFSLIGNIDCSCFSAWIRNQSSPEHRSNLSGNWNVLSAVPRNQRWSGCQIGRPTSSSAPNPTGVPAVILVSSRCFSRFGINRCGLSSWKNAKRKGLLVLVGMFRRCRWWTYRHVHANKDCVLIAKPHANTRRMANQVLEEHADAPFGEWINS